MPSNKEPKRPDPDDNSDIVKDHRALQNQSSVTSDEYPIEADKNQALQVPKKKG